jgi:glycosyltransferase involved in cell wall biosynthesis
MTPRVSLVIPCFNEEKTIDLLLQSIHDQTYPQADLETIIADGLSTDGTRQIIGDFQKAHTEMSIRIVDNPKKVIPAGLNAAILASRGELIIRMDAHTIPARDYIELSVKAFDEGKGEDVGGVIDITPGSPTWIGRSIAVATRHPLGVGDARYRWATKATYADTVAFGTYARKTFDKIGLYDESLVANEDYEMNARLRTAGGKIWIDPAIRATYHSRPDLASLARQYFTYGFYKLKMLKRFPATIRWRQALPPLFVLGVLMLLLLAAFWRFSFFALISVIMLYCLILLVAAIPEAVKKNDIALIPGIPLAIMTMHFSWGSGFWWSFFKGATDKYHGS